MNLYKEFKIGEEVWLDKDLANSSKVIVISQTPKRLYTTVKGNESTWDVMTYRLTTIT